VRLDRFDLNLLVVLDTLLEERNVTRASQRLHIGQSACSGALARLRSYFDDELLVPVGRRLELTPLAQGLVDPVRDALLRARAAIARRPGFDPALAERRFTVCASDYVTTVLLAQAVRRIAQQAPGLALDIRSPPKDLVQAFERGGIDLLVMPEQYAQSLPHPQARLFEDSHVCLVWQGHTGIGDTLDMAGYMAHGHVAVRFGDERSVAFEEWFLPRYGQQRRVEGSVDNFTTLPLLVIGTQRVATLHRRLAAQFVSHLPLRLLAAPFEMPPLVEVMVWPRYQDRDPAHAWLRQALLHCAAEMGAPAATPPARAPAAKPEA
jgi:DNA-binding transcriptional LysR family regulator